MTKTQRRRVKTKVENPDLVRQKHLQIIESANDLFSSKGYHKTTMREISSASGIELSYLYKYVSTKNDILYLFYEYLHDQWVESFQELESYPDQDLVRGLRIFIEKFIHTTVRLSDEILTMYTESRHLEEDWLHEVLALESENTRMIQRFLERGARAGVFDIQDSFMVANILQLLLVIRPLRGWNFKNQYTLDAFVELMTNFIFKGLGVSESPSGRDEHPVSDAQPRRTHPTSR